uniref:Transmembrane protein 179-like n=1 Tax=Gouania willdenowi TaxID=441366 RepID=A0A8C5E533_GOUWI
MCNDALWLCYFSSSNLFSSFLTVLLSVCVLFLSGGASIIMSLGFSSWCDVVTNNNMRPYSCADSQLVALHLDVDTSSFYTDLSLAQASLWAVTSLWLAQFLLSFLRLFHSHSQHLTGPCLLREKEMLLGSSLSSSSSSPSPPPLTPTLLI